MSAWASTWAKRHSATVAVTTIICTSTRTPQQAARDLFRWRMDGMGSPAIKTLLLDTYGRTLSEFSILRILGNPAYIGAVTGPNELIVHNAHEPLIDRATWDAVQRSLAHRRA
jgi:hypothetical protein